ncbi:HNH endonuclease signature motif containing protein [Streptomyces sp. NPDC048483]|uniref:HNH endonuclease n=1 Tax=Streptomyces sp. NPDC048483 TaxID=3154927 RepID=UPI00344A2344
MPRPVSPRIAELRARNQARLREQYEAGTLGQYIGIREDQVLGFGDPLAALAAMDARPGCMDGQEYRNRLHVMIARAHEMSEQERAAEQRFRKRQQERRRRSRIASQPRDRYTLAEVYERDGGECAHCFTAVPRQAGPRDPRAPQIDHIREIADGGSDTLDNVALTHRFCNADRSNDGRRATPQQARKRLEGRTARYLAEDRCSASVTREDGIFLHEIPCGTVLDGAGECKNAHRHFVWEVQG